MNPSLSQENALATARQTLLLPCGLDERVIEQTFGCLHQHRIDYADLYFQHLCEQDWFLEEGIVKAGSFSIAQGVGVRAISGEKTAFAYSDDLTPAALLDAATSVRAIAAQGGEGEVARLAAARDAWARPLYGGADPAAALEASARVAMLERLDALARAADPQVVEVMASLSSSWEVVLVARSDGALVADVRPLVRLSLTVLMQRDGEREQGYAGVGGRYGLERFDEDLLAQLAADAVAQARVNLAARPAPAGEMTVVLGAGWPGILLHEAIGHGLEGDFNRKGSSAFAGRLGERVAAAGISVVDDATLPQRRGSLHIDDEGTPGASTTLIEDGILTGYLQDVLNARLMGMAPTGNGRRESFAHLPLPRMTNTYMLAGKHAPEELIASVDKGLYAANFGGGQVDITSGKFVFSATEAYLIENGRITHPVKGATLIGNGPDVLTRVSMVGNDLALDPGIGTCGKNGQSVPVGVGQPSLRVDALTVGGTA